MTAQQFSFHCLTVVTRYHTMNRRSYADDLGATV
nr:MAG TPA: hypothetical protein [Caudoviricetes sp.]DAJ09552.1 MAG TPA: hypothetical protein [Caudoviricetes sp.]